MDPIRATLAAHLVTASASKREVSGVLVPFGVKGNASIGPIIYEPGSLEVHAERRRVKLLVQHDDERSVGYLTDVAMTDAEATGTFHLPAGPAGDLALTEAANGLRDAFSVGTEITEYTWADDGTLIAKAATLREVSLVSVPAYDDARVLDVAASRPTTTKGTTMPCSICGQVHAAGTPPCTAPPAPPVQADAAASAWTGGAGGA
ncbi:HK97 family phage prohead protease, partial [Cellulosimicrobium sp. I38E]|uniref:HK97 family phage prohead protease n=1 Tax=Cellulosimicrobium sp. I38E TaxID=1393139 RepID=UPI0012E90F57